MDGSTTYGQTLLLKKMAMYLSPRKKCETYNFKHVLIYIFYTIQILGFSLRTN